MRSLLALSLTLAACNTTPSEMSCPIGDPTQEIEIEIVHRAVGGGVTTTERGGTVPLILPPQGGKVMLVGIRAKNLDGCPVTVTGALRDPCNGDVIALEMRPVLLEETASGWGEPREPLELNNYSNLPACPRQGLTRQIDGEPYELELLVQDKRGRQASRTLPIVPVCAEPEFEEQCRCECSRDFVTIGTCDLSADAGVPPGTCPGDAG